MKLAAMIAAASTVPALADEVATYQLVWDAYWSAETHPGAYPGNGHFTNVLSTAHTADAVFWEPGGLATQGIEDMAEKGQGGNFELEVNAEIAAGNAREYFKLAGIPADDMPTVRIYEVEVTAQFPQLTMVSMIAPSPDWFIGVGNLDMRPGGEWLESLVIDIYGWDAGTDSGTEFTSPDDDTEPQEPITSLVGVHPFYDLPPIGTWTFTLLSVEPLCEADCNGDGALDILDFVCFQGEWMAQAETGDCNADGAYDVLDFVCFQGLFVAGCE